MSLSYSEDLRQAREHAARGSRIARTACGPIEYCSVGEGPAVLLVHGAGGGYDQMADFAAELAARGMRAVSMSRFGYLRTPLPADASPEAQADAHAALLDALGMERAAVVGVSAGAPSSMQFALRHPRRCSALVLLVPLAYSGRAAGAPPPIARLVFETALKSDFLFWLLTKAARPLLVRTVLATRPALVRRAAGDEQQRVRDIIDRILPVSERQPGMLNDAQVASSLGRYDLEHIAARTLVISTADDLYGTYDNARYTTRHVPNSRFVGYPSGGHVWVGHHRAVMAEISSFLRPQ